MTKVSSRNRSRSYGAEVLTMAHVLLYSSLGKVEKRQQGLTKGVWDILSLRVSKESNNGINKH